jgi:hypothetical protein
VLLVATFWLSVCGCTKQVNDVENVKKEESQELDVSGLDGKTIVAVEDAGNLVMIDLESKKSKRVHIFDDNELPPRRAWSTFKITPSNSHVVWYSPTLGILAYDIQADKVELVFKPSSWFNQYPFLMMHNKKDEVMFIDNEGKDLLRADMDGKVDRIEVPYPFGTRFLLSNDFEKIAYIAGYDEKAVKPTYLVTDINGNLIARFSTEGSLSERDMIVWHPEGNAILTKGAAGEIYQYELKEPDVEKVFFKPEKDKRVEDIKNAGDMVIIKLSDGSYQVLDANGKTVASYPASIMSGMQEVNLIPIDTNNYLLEEQVVYNGEKFSRLWQSNWLREREMIYPAYHQTTVISEPVELE